jgi:hypothetical protein
MCKINGVSALSILCKQRFFRRCYALIAVLAFGLNAFAPAISHAMLAQSGKTLVEICTAQGSAWVEVPSDDSPSAPKAAHDCAICLAASAPPAPTPSQTSDLTASITSLVVRLSAGTTQFASAIRPHAPATGPPSL